MDKFELVLSRLHAANALLEGMDENESESELISELKLAVREATVCAYRLRLGRTFEGYRVAGVI